MNQPPTPLFSPAATRRQFLFRGAAAVVFAALAWPVGGIAAPRQFVMKELSLDDLRLATFAGQLRTVFSVTDASTGRMELELIEASQSQSPSQTARALDAEYEKFSLIFRGPKAPVLAQQIYRFEHPQIGWFHMFIVPIVTPKTNEQHYQAIFNRPVVSEPSSIT